MQCWPMGPFLQEWTQTFLPNYIYRSLVAASTTQSHSRGVLPATWSPISSRAASSSFEPFVVWVMSWSQIFFQLTVSKLRMRGTTGIKQSHHKIQNAIAGNYDYNTGAKVTTKTTCVVQVPDFAAYVAHPQKHPSVRLSFCISSWIYLSIYPSIHPSIYLAVYPFIHLSVGVVFLPSCPF